MARPAGFDRRTVTRRARDVFWAHGYDAASIPELEAATGLSRSSLYNAFGSKQGLFDAAVDSYLTDVVRPRLVPLRVDPVAPGALDEYLHMLAAALGSSESLPATSGCLLINTACAPTGAQPEVSAAIRAYRRELHDAIGTGVTAARPRASAQEQARLTEAIAALVVSAYALVRVDPSAATDALSAARHLLD